MENIITSAHPCLEMSEAILGSPRSAVTSFTQSTPPSMASAATADFQVSTESQISLSLRRASIRGITLDNSSSREISLLPGPLDSPPISSQSAPREIIFRACSRALSKDQNFPPSEKESGVTFKTPINFGRSRSSARFLDMRRKRDKVPKVSRAWLTSETSLGKGLFSKLHFPFHT